MIYFPPAMNDSNHFRVFGALAADHDLIAFFYVFALLNTLQGLFIFIFHCAADEKFVV
jgi:hypothetical protein